MDATLDLAGQEGEVHVVRGHKVGTGLRRLSRQ
jgi:hypothetical protein